MRAATHLSTTLNQPIHAARNEPVNAEHALHRLLRRRGIAIRCRTAELAGALRRFRERQAEIDSGSGDVTIRMPAVAAGWIAAAA